MNRFLVVASIASLLILVIVRVILGISYERNCEGYLKRAADANTVEIAEQEMTRVTDYFKAQGLTEESGYTSVLYNTPDEHVGFWVKNLTEAHRQLKLYLANPAGEEELQLIKLRETILDQGSSGMEITAPTGISVFPGNTAFAFWGWISLIIGISAAISVARE